MIWEDGKGPGAVEMDSRTIVRGVTKGNDLGRYWGGGDSKTRSRTIGPWTTIRGATIGQDRAWDNLEDLGSCGTRLRR